MALSRRQLIRLEERRATVAIITIKTRTCLPPQDVFRPISVIPRSSRRLKAAASCGTPIYRAEGPKAITRAPVTLPFANFSSSDFSDADFALEKIPRLSEQKRVRCLIIATETDQTVTVANHLNKYRSSYKSFVFV